MAGVPYRLFAVRVGHVQTRCPASMQAFGHSLEERLFREGERQETHSWNALHVRWIRGGPTNVDFGCQTATLRSRDPPHDLSLEESRASGCPRRSSSGSRWAVQRNRARHGPLAIGALS